MFSRLLLLLALQLPVIFATNPQTVTTSKLVKSADGTTIYADAVGNPQNPSLVFVHGFALSGAVFDRLFSNTKLNSKYYLVRYDLRGHGRSGKPVSASAHVSLRYAQDFAAVSQAFALTKPVFVGWSLGAAVITDIVANLVPLPISAAVAIGGSPGISGDIIPKIASLTLLTILPQFNVNDNSTLSLDARVRFVDALFKDPSKVPFALKADYLGQTTVQSPLVSSLVSVRPQDPTKLFTAGTAGLKLQLISGNEDAQVIGKGVVSVFKPHFKNLVVDYLPGGHAIFEDNQDGVICALDKFVDSVRK